MNGNTRPQPEALLPTRFGTFKVRVYETDDGNNATAIISEETEGKKDLPLRVHSACFTGEALHSLKCECKDQLDLALSYIGENGGVVIYLSQEGRGIGLGNKIRAYALQEQGYDTVDANLKLGFPADLRTYDEAAMIIKDLGIQSIRLLTNNPEKVHALKELGINVTGRIPVLAKVNEHSAGYIETKRVHMGHMLELEGSQSEPTRPFVHVNFAMNDCRDSDSEKGSQINLSCKTDWNRVHRLRETYSGIAVGANTWEMDQPRLTARQEFLGRAASRQPDRVIFAGKRACNFKADERRTFVVGSNHPKTEDGRIAISMSDYKLVDVLYGLREKGITSLLVEGGPTLIRSFLEQGFVDMFTIYVCTVNSEIALSAANKMFSFTTEDVQLERFGEGTLLTIQNPKYLKSVSVVEQKEVIA